MFSGVGGGKTVCGCFEILSILLENPGAVGYIFEPTYKMVRRILIPTLESKYLLNHPIDSNPVVSAYKRGDGLIEFVDEQSLWFGSLEEPEFAEGANVDVVLIDEAQYIKKFAESQDVVLRRLRGSGKTVKDITQSLVTTTPPPLLPNCRLYDFYENPETRNAGSRVYRWSMLDNIYLSEEYKSEIIATHHGHLAKRFIEGLFAPIGIGSFAFDSTVHEMKTFENQVFAQIVYGVDFGWTNPSAIVCVGLDGDGRAYILDEFYQNRTQIETLVSELKLMQQQFGYGKIMCDRSEPQAINNFRLAGLNAVADASKREDGIHELGSRFMVQPDGKPRIYVSSKCVNWIHEVMVYNAEIKENDHACLVAETEVQSDNGKILTPFGYCDIELAGLTERQAQVYTANFSDGTSLTGTANHPIFVYGLGFIPLIDLRKGFIVDATSYYPWNQKQSSTKTYLSDATPTVNDAAIETTTDQTLNTSETTLKLFTLKYGKTIMEQCLTDYKFTTKTETQATTISPTLNLPHQKHIALNIHIKKATQNTLNKQENSPKFGTKANKDINGIANIGKHQSVINKNLLRNNASFAGQHLSIEVWSRKGNFAVINAKPVTFVNVEKQREKQAVYNLKVKDAGCYYANGILTHNCDATRYAVMSVKRYMPEVSRKKINW